MKSNKLLAKSITLGLILAMPYGVVSANEYLDGEYIGPYTSDNDRYVVSGNSTLSGKANETEMVITNATGKGNMLVQGVIKDANSLTVNGDGVTVFAGNGKIENINTVAINGVLSNLGTISIGDLIITGTGTSTNNGKITATGTVTTSGTFNNQDTFNANNLVLGGNFQNRAETNIASSIKGTGNFTNYAGGNLNTTNVDITGTFMNNDNANATATVTGTLKATTVTNGIGGTMNLKDIEASIITNKNDAKLNIKGDVAANSLTNNGTLTADSLAGENTNIVSLNNTGTLIVNDGNLKTGTFTNNGSIKTGADAAENGLNTLTVTGRFNNGNTNLNIGTLNVGEKVVNSGTLKVETLETNSVNNSGNLTVTNEFTVNDFTLGENSTTDVSNITVNVLDTYTGSTLTAEDIIIMDKGDDGSNQIRGMIEADTLTNYDDIEIKHDIDINNLIAHRTVYVREEAGSDVSLNDVTLENGADIQLNGDKLTIENLSVNGNGGLSVYYRDPEDPNSYESGQVPADDDKKIPASSEKKYIQITGSVNVADNAVLTVTNNADQTSSLDMNEITLGDNAILQNVQRETRVGLSDAFDNLTIGNLNGNNSSIINEGKMYIGKLDGTDNNIEVHSLDKAQITIGTNNSTGLQVTGTSEATSQFNRNDLAGSLQDLADTVSIGSGNQLDSVLAQESGIIGETTALVDEYGNIIANTVIEKGHIANEGITELANVAFMAWRAENDEMHQRMGELRSSNGEAGIWARMKRGESKYGDMDIKNQYSTYQLGYDEKVGDSNWYIGGAISRTEGKSSFATGSGENQSTGFTVYGTYVADDGQYVDLSAKYARLDNEFDVFGRSGIESTGDYRNNGYAFSAEYGKRIETGNDFWVEPQVQLTYGHLSSANYTTSRDVRVTQDAMDSVVGRLGFAAGKDIGVGNVYVKASYLYDFDGDTNVKMTDGKNSAVYDQDLGGGWFEVGIGTNINLSETSHLYFDVEKTYGGDIETPWQWNAGVRFDF